MAKVKDLLAAKAAEAKATEAEVKVYEYPENWKPPKTLGIAVDNLWTVRQERLALQKKVEELAVLESAYKHYLIDTLPSNDSNGVAGKLCRVSVKYKDVPQVLDWDAVYRQVVKDYTSHVKKKDGQEAGAFALLQRRLGDAAVKEAWANGKEIEGVGRFSMVDLSINKL